jgi:predicted amidohydrolase
VAPWGEVLADAGSDPGVTMVEIDLAEVDRARARVPSLTHDRAFEGP